MEEVTPEEVSRRLEELQVVDIRPAAEYERGHIPGAENLPAGEFAARVDERDWGDEVVLVCHVGESSVRAARLLESFEGAGDTAVASMAGGYRAWDGDLESEDGSGEAAPL
jgi:rhodanese-related sulfurtransferase